MKNKSFLMLSAIFLATLFSCQSGSSGDKQTTEETVQTEEATNNPVQTEEAMAEPATEASVSATTDEAEPFSYLKKMAIGRSLFLKYNQAKTTVYGKSLNELDKKHPLYTDSPMSGQLLVKTEVTSGQEYYVVFSEGPSADPTFIFHKVGQEKENVFSVGALEMYVPSNGAVYSAGHTNNMFNMRKKFVLTNGKFVEEKQPYYYVGLKTETLMPVKLYASQRLSNEVASLPKGYSVEVLINKPDSDLFLVKTDFGLTGWMKAGNGWSSPPNIKGIRLLGD